MLCFQRHKRSQVIRFMLAPPPEIFVFSKCVLLPHPPFSSFASRLSFRSALSLIRECEKAGEMERVRPSSSCSRLFIFAYLSSVRETREYGKWRESETSFFPLRNFFGPVATTLSTLRGASRNLLRHLSPPSFSLIFFLGARSRTRE